MGQGESTLNTVPFEADLDYELPLSEDAVSAGFGPNAAAQQEALDAAVQVATATAALNLVPPSPEMPPENSGKAFSVSGIERFVSEYELEKKVLGEGGFGMVKCATSRRTGHTVAVKIIKRKKLNERSETLLQREVKHHEKVRPPSMLESLAFGASYRRVRHNTQP
eukprot:148879-Prymnesium_polylepis.1